MFINDLFENKKTTEGSVQDRLHRRHQELRKKSGLPDPDYYKELKTSYDIEDDAKRIATQAEIKKKYKVAEANVKKPQPYNKPGWWKELSKDELEALAGPRDKKYEKKKQDNTGKKKGVAETALNPKDPQGDYDAKRKVIHDLSLDPNVDQQAVQQRRLDLDREAKSKGLKEQGVAEGAGMGDHRYEVKHKDIETGEVKSSKVRAMSPKEARREVENHYSHSSSRWKHIDTRKIDEGVAEGSLDEIDRRGFLKGLGAAAVTGGGGYLLGKSDSTNNEFSVKNLSTEDLKIVDQFLLDYVLLKDKPYIVTGAERIYYDSVYEPKIKNFINAYGPEGKNLINSRLREIKHKVQNLSGQQYTILQNKAESNSSLSKFEELIPTFNESIQGVAEGVERYLEEMRRAGYDIVTERATLCPECGGPAYEDKILAEKQDACYHKVKSRYKVWPSAYASGALVRCRKVGAKNWGNKSKK